MQPISKTEKLLLQVQHDGNGLVDKIQEYSRSQVKLWRQVPALALEADGRSGFSETYACAYHNGIWRLWCSVNNGYYRSVIDLRTGTIVDSYHKTPQEGSYILLLFDHLDELDAQKIVGELKEHSKIPYSTHYSKEEVDKTLRNKEKYRIRMNDVMKIPVLSLPKPQFSID